MIFWICLIEEGFRILGTGRFRSLHISIYRMKENSLLVQLMVKQTDENHFTGGNYDIGTRAIFGGHVLAQAILAAYEMVPAGRYLHSLHAYFVLPGDPTVDIRYRVDHIRDGGSFSTRRISAIQHGKEIFIMAASFQREEIGYDHQDEAPRDVPSPEEVQSFDLIREKLLKKLPSSAARLLEIEFPFEFKPMDNANPLMPGKHAAQRKLWFRYRDNEELTRPQQEALLAYVSDYNLLSTAILPHEEATYSNTIMASIDHAMWFFRPFDVREWNLYSLRSPTAISARGFTTGAIYNRSGDYLVRIAQEGLIRPVTE